MRLLISFWLANWARLVARICRCLWQCWNWRLTTWWQAALFWAQS